MPDDRGQFDLHNESFSSLTVIYVEGSDYNPSTSSSSANSITVSATVPNEQGSSHPAFTEVSNILLLILIISKKSLVYSRYNQVSSPMWYINQYACISLHRSVLGHKSGARYNLKIIKARLDMVGKKPSFDKGEVTYVEIKESTATVAHIASEIRGVWGQEYCIVTSDGMEVRDSSGTRGKHYLIWSYIV